MKILLIEADSDLQAILAYALRREGHDIATAEPGSLAIAQALTVRPDAILLHARGLGLAELDPSDLVGEGIPPAIISYEHHVPFGLDGLLAQLRSLTPR